MGRISVFRRIKDRMMTLLIFLAAAVCLLPLLNIVFIVAVKGMKAISLSLFTTVTSGIAGGLANAIAGTLLLVLGALLFSAPLGIFGGLYLSEFSSGRFSAILKTAVDVLSGVPSIVLGYFGYVVMVIWLKWGFSLLAAAITLTIIMLPYIMRSSEIAMRKVPQSWREASLALGAGKSATALRIVLRAAIPGILTGVIIAVSIAMGETAPLIYTAGWSNYMPTGRLTHSPVGYLTYVVWTYINEPYSAAHALAYAAALLLMVMILAFNVAGRLILKKREL